MKPAAAVLMLSLAALVAGCAGPRSLVPGQSTEADVRASMGAPTGTRTEGGDKLWEYATGPEGVRTDLVRIGADGKVKEVTQLLTEDRLNAIVPGKTTQAEVRNLLGRPAFEITYRAGLGWSWRHLKGGVQPGYIVVSFNPDGTVRERLIILDQQDLSGGK